MALPFSFSNNTSPTGVQLDADLAALGAMGTQLCVATGTNTITLTPGANQPTVAAYVNQQLFVFTAVNSSSGAVTARVNALASLPLYVPGGAQAGSGDIVNGSPYLVQYLAALNSSSGGFIILSAVPASSTAPVVVSSAKGLTVNNNSGTPSTKIDITAGYTVLGTTGGTPKFLSSVSVTIDLTTTGANGMDTGARPTSGWAYCYIINNGSVTAGLATATSPTAGLPSPFPGGYSNFMYVGAMYCDGSQNLLRTQQKGKNAGYTVMPATNTASFPVLVSGSSGNPTSGPTLTSISLINTIPLTAGAISGLISLVSGSSSVIANPNANCGTVSSTSNAPAVGLTAGTANQQSGFRFVVQGTTMFWASNGASNFIAAIGWEDYWVSA